MLARFALEDLNLAQQQVLIVDDDTMILQLLRSGLQPRGYHVDVASGGKQGLEKLDATMYDVLLVDLSMPEVDGFQVMKHALKNGRARAVIVITGQATMAAAIDSMRAGAVDFIPKPFEAAAVIAAIERAAGNAAPSPDDSFRARFAPDIIGESPRVIEMLIIIERIADTDCNVLITGESGTGKELVARAVHKSSRRSEKPFVPVNCAAIPKELMESEVFGHVKGAFTGALDRHSGRFQVAEGGTLFLDEVGEMDLGLQAKFLRVIQEKEYTPVGSSKSVHADVRIVAATNQDLEAACHAGRFRDDLYYRLAVVPIHVVPLRERAEDIPRLAEHFVTLANRRHSRKVDGFAPEVLEALTHYRWPGNIREMANSIERIVVIKGEGKISASDLPKTIVGDGSSADAFASLQLPPGGLDITDAIERVEARLTMDALRRSQGNKAKAAELLGLKRTTLVERLKKLKIPDPDD